MAHAAPASTELRRSSPAPALAAEALDGGGGGGADGAASADRFGKQFSGAAPRRSIQSWGVYGEQSGVPNGVRAAARDGAAAAPAAAADAQHSPAGGFNAHAQQSSLEGLAEMVTQPCGHAPAGIMGHHDPGARQVPALGLTHAMHSRTATPALGGAGVLALGGHEGLMGGNWGMGGATFIDVCCDESGLAGLGAHGGAYPDLPGIADECELAAVLGLPSPAAAPPAARGAVAAACPELSSPSSAGGRVRWRCVYVDRWSGYQIPGLFG